MLAIFITDIYDLLFVLIQAVFIGLLALVSFQKDARIYLR